MALGAFLTVTALTGLLVVGLEADRRKTESTLRSSEERFRAMIENATDLVTVLGRDGTILYQSPSVERILGWAPGALSGQKVARLDSPVRSLGRADGARPAPLRAARRR